MIHTEKGETKIRGPRAEIVADFFCIMSAGMKECPAAFVVALELLEREAKEELRKEAEEGSTEDERLAAFATALATLPEEEREKLRKKMGD